MGTRAEREPCRERGRDRVCAVRSAYIIPRYITTINRAECVCIRAIKPLPPRTRTRRPNAPTSTQTHTRMHAHRAHRRSTTDVNLGYFSEKICDRGGRLSIDHGIFFHISCIRTRKRRRRRRRRRTLSPTRPDLAHGGNGGTARSVTKVDF